MNGNGRTESLIDSISASYPTATMTFTMTRIMAEDAARETRRAIVETTPCRNGRAIVRVKPRFS